jgi:dimethylamine/trimethylamine dehydrogenase
LIESGVHMIGDKGLVAWDGKTAELECAFSGAISAVEADALIPVTARLPNDELFHALAARGDDFTDSGGLSFQRIGDCRMPGIIAMSVYDGHKAARELGEPPRQTDLRRDRIVATKLEPFK